MPLVERPLRRDHRRPARRRAASGTDGCRRRAPSFAPPRPLRPRRLALAWRALLPLARRSLRPPSAPGAFYGFHSRRGVPVSCRISHAFVQRGEVAAAFGDIVPILAPPDPALVVTLKKV